MKNRKSLILTSGTLLLAIIALTGLAALGASAAPALALAGTAMEALPEANCTVVETTRTCDLWTKSGSLAMPDGTSVPVWGFASSADGPALVPGPVIAANVGETVEIVLHNELPGQMVSLAFPAQEGIPDLDGIASGEMFTYILDLTQPGTFLYEAGLTAGGSRQVAMGLFGPLIVADTTAPTWNQEVVLVLSEVDPAFNAAPESFSMAQFKPRYWLINGRSFPDTGWIGTSAGDTVLIRYLNAGLQTHSISLLGLEQMVQSANGEPLPFARGAIAEALAAGETRDVLVDIPAGAVTDTAYALFDASLRQHNNNQRLPDMRAAFGGMLAFINVTTGADPSLLGPVVSAVTVTPAKTGPGTDVVLAATLTDDDGVAAFETFVDTLGAPGTGTITVIDPATSPYAVEVTFPATELDLWSSGQHTFYVRGQDSLGNWGNPGSAVLTLDKAGPVISGLGLDPNPTNGLVSVVVGATADDNPTGASIVVAGEFRLNGGAWQPMIVNPGDSTVAGLSATIPVDTMTALTEGQHLVEVQAQDDLGNWSATPGAVQLVVDKSGPNVPLVTLVPNVIDLNQPLPASVRLDATLEDPLANGVQTTVANAEAFIDTVGAPGSGIALYPSDGLFDEATETAYYQIPASAFAVLAPGTHQVLVVGVDSVGNYGAAGSATIEIIGTIADTSGPVVTNVVADPNPAQRDTTATLTATATDTQTNIVEVVWFQGTDPSKAKAFYTMTAVDGAFDELSEDVTGLMDLTRWRTTTWQISVRARDAAGNWGPITTIDLIVTR